MAIPVVLLLSLQLQSPYADSATAALIARARERHHQQDVAVHDYTARLRTRASVDIGRGGFARLIPFAVQEQESDLHWQAPNDLKVVAVGERSRAAWRGLDMEIGYTNPWFIPRFLGDSIHLLGDGNFPDRPAVHPLSQGADAYYRYAIFDSLELALPGRAVRAIGVRITPIRSDASLIAGEIWLDAATAETVRLSFTFVGKRVWVDSIRGTTRQDTVRAERENALVERILRVSADMEYGLYDQRYWLPYRQAITLDVQLPWFKNLVVPVHFSTTFRDVHVNEGGALSLAELPPDTTARAGRRHRNMVRRCGDRAAAGDSADTLEARHQSCVTVGTWAGGRYEIDVPPDSQLRAYRGWTDSLRFGSAPDDAARLEDLRRDVLATLERLPDSLTGRPRFSVAFDRLTDVWRYNRAEGASLGWGYEWRTGVPFVSVLARARYAFTDERLQGALTLRRDAPGSRIELQAFREMRDADPMAPGLTTSNSFAALLTARDDGDYVFTQGGALRYQRPLGRVADLTLEAGYGDETAPRRLAHAGVNDVLGGRGDFDPNGPVLPGHFWVAGAEVAGGARPFNWRAGVEGTAGARQRVRGWLAATGRATPVGWLDVTAAGWIGAGGGDSLPQRDFRLGGARTLRGYPAGWMRGPSAWAASLDVAFDRLPVSPIVFADVGQAAAHRLDFSSVAGSFGAGVSVLGGAVRFDAARPVAPKAAWRYSLSFAARR